MTYKARRPVPMLRDRDAFFVSDKNSMEFKSENSHPEKISGGYFVQDLSDNAILKNISVNN
ncbi:MAG: hypothetical protein KAU44_01690 [Candidatus Marinimicrobia bacterium]|nr:hypothetical protein [Candidatus Neomarinimicrobiota bacterium]